ncbi:MAG: dihydrofolate reductase family protein [Acidimicrobiales bacterium]|nr:dihydrofolate reductase family protein [Acidimicrobiales bacterium]
MVEDLPAFYRIGPAPPDRPWVVVSMVATVDGATALDGVSGALGNDTDREVLRLARAAADVIVVGAATVRAEQYRPVREPKQLVVVSRNGDLGGAPAAGAPNTHIVRPEPDGPDGLAALLARYPGRVVVCEGGPSLNGQVLAAGLADEVLVTISPRLVAGGSARLAHGPDQADPTPWELRHVLVDEDHLFVRYRRRGEATS